jgi:hypothetical protein
MCSFTGIALSYWLGKVGDFKPTFSVPTPAKYSVRQLLHTITVVRVRCKHLDVANRNDTSKFVKCNLGLLALGK